MLIFPHPYSPTAQGRPSVKCLRKKGRSDISFLLLPEKFNIVHEVSGNDWLQGFNAQRQHVIEIQHILIWECPWEPLVWWFSMLTPRQNHSSLRNCQIRHVPWTPPQILSQTISGLDSKISRFATLLRWSWCQSTVSWLGITDLVQRFSKCFLDPETVR